GSEAHEAPPVRKAEGVQVLLGQGRPRRLQGRASAAELGHRARQAHPTPDLGQLRAPSAPADARHQARPHGGPAAVRGDGLGTARMKVILLDDVASVGRRGDVRDVSDGYARNFLIPKKLALSASAGNLKNLEHIKNQQEAKAERIKGDAHGLQQRIEALTYEERRQASEEGKLFGSVTSQDIADFLGTRGIDMDRKRITLEEPIKTLGDYSVSMRLHPDVTAQLKVTVVREWGG